jgi:type IV secretory pathway VirB10-like protein
MINFKFTQCKLSQTLTFLMIFFYFLGSSLAKAEVIFAETPSVTPPPLETPSVTPPPLETPSVTPPPLETPSVTSPPKSTLDKMDRENQQTNPRPLGCKLRTVCPKEKQLGCRTYLECPKK